MAAFSASKVILGTSISWLDPSVIETPFASKAPVPSSIVTASWIGFSYSFVI